MMIARLRNVNNVKTITGLILAGLLGVCWNVGVAAAADAVADKPVGATRTFKLHLLEGDKRVAAVVSVRTGKSQKFVYVRKAGTNVTTALAETTVTSVQIVLKDDRSIYEGRITVKPTDESATFKAAGCRLCCGYGSFARRQCLDVALQGRRRRCV